MNWRRTLLVANDKLKRIKVPSAFHPFGHRLFVCREREKERKGRGRSCMLAVSERLLKNPENPPPFLLWHGCWCFGCVRLLFIAVIQSDSRSPATDSLPLRFLFNQRQTQKDSFLFVPVGKRDFSHHHHHRHYLTVVVVVDGRRVVDEGD